MATASITYQPAAGRAYIDLTSWAGSALFASTPVAGEQIEGPDTLTYPTDSDPTGADGTYTLRHIKLDGSVEAVSYTITTADTQEPTLTSPSAIVTGSTTLDASVSTNEADGTLYTLASANATETANTVKTSGQSQAVIATGPQSVSITGLTASSPYYVHFMHEDAATNQSAVATSAQVTTDTAPTASSATATVAYDAPTGKTDVTLATGFDNYIFQEWATQPVAGEQIVFTDAELNIDELANVITDTEDVFNIWFVELDGTVTATTIDTTGLNSAVEGFYPFSKNIKYATTRNWDWGNRHPKTGMRVRVHK